MTEVSAVTAISGKGFEADTSFGRPTRQVLLIDLETLTEFGIRPGDVRENVTVEGIDLSGLSPNDELTIGGALLTVTGHCEPCSKLDELRPGLSSDIEGKRGVFAQVVSTGEVRINDPIALARVGTAAGAL